jgi:hypothetical protein
MAMPTNGPANPQLIIQLGTRKHAEGNAFARVMLLAFDPKAFSGLFNGLLSGLDPLPGRSDIKERCLHIQPYLKLQFPQVRLGRREPGLLFANLRGYPAAVK